jgi:hypothetical protein
LSKQRECTPHIICLVKGPQYQHIITRQWTSVKKGCVIYTISPSAQLTGADGKKPDLEISLAVPSGYAWQYIFAIVAFSIKIFRRGTKQVALSDIFRIHLIWWYDLTRLSIEALNGCWWYLTENFSLRIAVNLEGFHLNIWKIELDVEWVIAIAS